MISDFFIHDNEILQLTYVSTCEYACETSYKYYFHDSIDVRCTYS